MKINTMLSLCTVGVAMMASLNADAKDYAMKIAFKSGATEVQHELPSVAKLTFTDAQSAGIAVTTDSATTRNDAGDILHITFSGDKMVVTTAEGATEHSIPSISKIDFDLTATINDDVAADLGNVAVAIASGVVTATSPSGEAVTMILYSADGSIKGFAKGEGAATLDLSELARGVYIVKVNNKTVKVTL